MCSYSALLEMPFPRSAPYIIQAWRTSKRFNLLRASSTGWHGGLECLVTSELASKIC
jgi:hypothetical protein